MAFTAAVATVASAAVSTYSTYQQTKAAKAQANYQSAIARNNVIITRHNQQRIRQQADEAEADQRRRTSQMKGSVRASAAASGLLIDDTQDSTVQGLLADVNAEGMYDILKIRDTRENEIRNSQIQGMEYQAKADLFKAKADNYNPTMAAAGTLLGSSGDIYTAGKGAKWW